MALRIEPLRMSVEQPEIRSLTDFLREKERITKVEVRVRMHDAAPAGSLALGEVQITGLAITAAGIVGKKIVDFVSDCVKEWLNERKIRSQDVLINIYGADEKVVSRVKKRLPPKAK